MPKPKAARRSNEEATGVCPDSCPDWHTVKQAAVHIGMSERWFQDNCTQAEHSAIPYHDMGLGRRRVPRFRKRDLDAFVEACRVETA